VSITGLILRNDVVTPAGIQNFEPLHEFRQILKPTQNQFQHIIPQLNYASDKTDSYEFTVQL
jgi:hypothetical protein